MKQLRPLASWYAKRAGLLLFHPGFIVGLEFKIRMKMCSLNFIRNPVLRASRPSRHRANSEERLQQDRIHRSADTAA